MKMTNRPLAISLLVITTFSIGHVRLAQAADTIETWDVGATDLDFYTGYNGLGGARTAHGIYGDLMLGYGLVERFSAYIGQSLKGNGYFTAGEANTYLGIYGTPVDTRHFDLDLFLGFSLGGPQYREVGLTPMMELNFDLDPNRQSWGAYVRTAFRLHGQTLGDEENPSFEILHELTTVVGTYYTIKRKHQLLLELDFTWRTKAADGARKLEIGGVALGYNVTLSERIELISQVSLDVPQSGERFNVGLMLGFIVTLPSAKKK